MVLSFISPNVFMYFFFCSPGDAACDEVTEYTCQNEACIPLHQYNNSVNDCGDNSDEGKRKELIKGTNTILGLTVKHLNSPQDLALRLFKIYIYK